MMEGDTLINSDSGSFDSLTFFPSADSRLSKKRSFEQLSSTIDSPSTASAPATTTTPSSALAEQTSKTDKKKRKVSFMIDDDNDDKENEKANNAPAEIRLSPEEIEEMKRKAEQWWNLPAGTTQEEFDNALANFKEGKYFELLMEIEWIDVLLQRACARVVSSDQFSEAAQDLCAAIHAAMTRNDTDLLKKLAHGDAELLSLTKQYTEDSADLLVARQALTDQFGVIHSAKIAIKSEVYVSSATRLKQAGKEVTDAAVEEELAAFERGMITVPGSRGGGGCVVGYTRSTSPGPGASGGCPVRHQPDAAAASDPQSPRPPQDEPRVCPYTGHKASTSGDEGRHAHEEALGGGGDAATATTTTTTATTTTAQLPGVCPYKAPTSGDEGRQAREEQEHQEDEPPHERSSGGDVQK